MKKTACAEPGEGQAGIGGGECLQASELRQCQL